VLTSPGSPAIGNSLKQMERGELGRVEFMDHIADATRDWFRDQERRYSRHRISPLAHRARNAAAR
jgi:hypothetical protein